MNIFPFFISNYEYPYLIKSVGELTSRYLSFIYFHLFSGYLMDNHQIMTMKEVSEYLRVSERTVLDWAQKAEIPCGKLGSSWRFKREDIEDWLNQRLSSSPASNYHRIKLELILNPDCVLIEDSPLDKESALTKLVDVICQKHGYKNSEVKEAIFHREELMSTGIGLGIAVPHVRIKNVRDISMGAMLVRDNINDYEALDGKPVKLIFMILANEAHHTDYLKFLSALSKQLQVDSYRDELCNVEDPDNFYIKLIRGI
jgi:nitrogen PTS system EIIA component